MTILDIFVKSTALLAIAAIVDAVLRRRGSASVRHLVWVSAIAGLLALPMAEALVPHWTVPIPIASAQPAPAVSFVADASREVAPDATESRTRMSAAGTVSAAPPRRTISPATSPATALFAVYVLGLVFLLARLFFEPLALRRIARASHEMTDDAWRQVLAEAAAQLHIPGPIRLLRFCDEIVPMTFGTRQPSIVVPPSSDVWPDDRRRAVLLHELAHVVRRDCLAQLLAAIVCALYWPHPGVWLAARRLRLERELACDDRVIAAGAEPQEYARHLLELARSLRPAPVLATALAMARARDLEHRLLAIVDAARNRTALPRRRGATAAAVSVAVLLAVAAIRTTIKPVSAFAQDARDLSGTWEVRLSADRATARVVVRTAHGSHGETMPTARLDTLTGVRIAGLNGPVRFPIRRDAGTFMVDGKCAGDVCAGVVAFEPDAAFAAALGKRGIGAPTPAEQFQLALRDIGNAFLDELARDGYARTDIHGLVRAAQHGVDAEYLRQMTALGYRVGTLDALIRMRDQGIDPEYVRGMAAAGLTRLSADDLVRARDHGVDPSYVKGMRSHGYASLDLDGLIDARNHGVDPDYIRGMRELGYRGSLADLRQLRDRGVDPEYVRGLALLGYKGLPVDVLVRLRDHGVDPEYVRALASLGYKDLPLETLVRLRDHGVDPAYVRSVKDKGLGQLTPDQLIDRRDRGLDDPSVAVREMLGALQSVWRSLVGR